MTSKRLVFIFFLIALAAAAKVFLGGDDSLVQLKRAGVIRIGYAIEAPYAFVTDDGQVKGEAPEIAEHVVHQLGIHRIDWRQMEFGELMDALLAHRIDVIASGMFITPERQKQVLFSLPTLAVRAAMLVARGNPKRVMSYQDAKRPDVRVAVLDGATEAQRLRQMGVPSANLVVVPDALTGRRAVERGQADVLLLSEPTLGWMIKHDPSGRSEMLPVPPTDPDSDTYGQPAFAFRPDAVALQAAWNDALIPYLHSPEHSALLARLGITSADPQMDAR
ncbi:MAG TPA: transporter substrate-binding domain-containing protein [Aquabacterium sp.]|nr:transporter substrate-binding domain-containing protein [Aquabacterium sp.]